MIDDKIYYFLLGTAREFKGRFSFLCNVLLTIYLFGRCGVVEDVNMSN